MSSMKPLRILINPYQDLACSRAIFDILDSYARDVNGGGQPLDQRTRVNLVSELRRRPWIVTLLAVLGDDPVGLLIAMEGFSTFKAQPLLNIHDVAVLPQHRGKGIGKALFVEIERVARQRNCCKLTLEVLSGNEGAKRLYQSLGFGPYALDPQMGTAQFWEKPLLH